MTPPLSAREVPVDFDKLTEPERVSLDELFASRASPWWDGFYEVRAKPCPFFGAAPDESLASWLNDGAISKGRALDLGCGNGRNAIHLARNGFTVEAVDYSKAAIDWAQERSAEAGVTVSFKHQNVFDLGLAHRAYDLVYDSGCFHHMPPHRRRTYVELVGAALKPRGWFGLTCFQPEGGSGYADSEVYDRRSLGGGLGYSEAQLRQIWSNGLDIRELRQMRKPSVDSGLFGEPFLWVLLAQKA